MMKASKITKIITGIVIGLVLSFSAALLYISDEIDLKQFYSVGKSDEISEGKLVCYGYGWEHLNDDPQTLIATEKKVVFKYYKTSQEIPWAYLDMYIDNMNMEAATATFTFYDEQKQKVGEQEVQLVNGLNTIELPQVFYSYIRVTIRRQIGLSFRIASAVLTTTHKTLDIPYFIQCMIWIMIAYIGVWIILYFINGTVRTEYVRRLYSTTGSEVYQYALAQIGHLGNWFAQHVPRYIKKRLRITLFSLLII